MVNIKEFFGKKELVLGTWVSMPDPDIIEFVKAAGFDFIRIDNEYAPLDIGMIAHMIRVANIIDIPVIVRISRLEDISMLLSHGANGIMIPDGSLARVKEVIHRAKYVPIGKRSMASESRAVRTSGLSFKEYHQKANAHVSVVVQIEDHQGLAELDEILKLEGVDIIGSGRSDIAQVLGVPGEISHPKVIEFEDTIIKKTLEHGKIPMLQVSDTKDRDALLKKGVYVQVFSKDDSFLQKAMRSAVREFKG